MDLNSYQKNALRTDRVPTRDDDISLIVPMLGLAGETGQLLSEYKKHLRDGEAHRLFKERVSEELGDLLWYVAKVASEFDLLLSDIAAANLVKVKHRWASERAEPLIFDAKLPEGERLPRRLEVELIDVDEDTHRHMQILVNGKVFGAELTDNAYDPDGYRFHDVFHLAYAAVLGWSPITRGLLQRKRKSRPLLDEVEDGGRAAVIEEGVVALAFDYARRHHFLEGIAALDSQLLRTIKDMTSHLEVRQCTTGEWERAILQGFDVWRAVLAASGGRIAIDLDARSITFLGPSADQELPA
ncbi:MAG: nucleoside triphosphate pyrophosphohydrolase family protein [Bryobacterales bacterium]|nr:nucleoside triphosphate pyrophosphohydrolase family protein [Bryobacterales bacterium]